MKKFLSIALAFSALAIHQACAQLTILASGYSVAPYYTDITGDDIVSYDWDSSTNLYYMTATASFGFGGIFQYNGTTTTQPVPASGQYPGNSVVTIGNYVYFNDDGSNQHIYGYGPVTTGSPTSTQLLTASNYGLYGHNGSLFVTGAPGFGTNHIYYSALGSDGHLLNAPLLDLGVTSGGSGPLAFDHSGNLYYAPGYGDQSIYKWSAADVANAIANNVANPLTVAGHQWLDYSGQNLTQGGATSMILGGNGDLLVTLTNFGNPSFLVDFGVAQNGSYNGTETTILSSAANNRLGELRSLNGDLYVSSGDQVVKLVPEPASGLLALSGLSMVLFGRARRRTAQNADSDEHHNRTDRLPGTLGDFQ